MTPNDRVKKIRELLNMSQKEFSDGIGIKQGTLSDIERGKIGVSAKTKNRMSEKYGISSVWITTGEIPIISDISYIKLYSLDIQNNIQNYENSDSTAGTKQAAQKQLTEKDWLNNSFPVKHQHYFKAHELLKNKEPDLYNLKTYIDVVQSFADGLEWLNEGYLDGVLKHFWRIRSEKYTFDEYFNEIVKALKEAQKYKEAFEKLAKSIDQFYNELETIGKDEDGMSFDPFRLNP